VIRKEKDRPKGRDHINGIEGFWSYTKHWLSHYSGFPKNYFHLYLKEIEWRFNHRNENLVKLLRTYLNQLVLKDQV
jgi:transposase